MDPHASRLLEFPVILGQLEDRCFSEPGRRLMGEQPILTEPQAVQERLALAVSFRRLLESGEALPPLDFPDPAAVLSRLGKEGVAFEPEELAALGRFLASAGRLKQLILQRAAEEPIAAIAARIPLLESLVREIFRVLDREGNLKEKSLPALAHIREQIRSIQLRVDRMVSGYLESPEYRSYWQTDLPTQKDGRTVLPLKSNFKGRIPGIVHDVSASGATVFMEPMDVVEKNNELVEARTRYQREVARILRELSARVNESTAAIQALVAETAVLDTCYARAMYAIHHRCVPAGHRPAAVDLREARHPLLGRDAVPNTVVLGGEHRIMIVTGPNTGGKTVMLKTIGLLALMNQFGMEIPAAEGSALGVFDQVFADVGDEQSIEQSLSTFSGHIINIAGIVERATDRSLILLDELGAGTDPEEGVALAMALLDHFLAAGGLVAVTTHHGILKNYGYSRAGVQNASMEFDRQSLQPTFRLVLGIPGESQALEIAHRYGIPEPLVERARGYLRDERGDISELIRKLTDRERQLRLTAEEQRMRESELRERSRETGLKELRLRQREHELRRQGLRDLRGFLAETRSSLEQLLRELKEGNLERAREAQGLLQRVEERTREEEQKLAREEEDLFPLEAGEIRPGMEVLIGGSGRRGRVIRKDRGNSWVVETGAVRVSLTPRELRPANRALSGDPPRLEEVSISREIEAARPSFELDLRGLRLEEAIQRLQRQVDQALVSGLAEFHVIHGKGEGVLQRGIHQYLKESPGVREYYFAPLEEGGFGKTIVRL
jgi:DNA mismatch repair protein MutS2